MNSFNLSTDLSALIPQIINNMPTTDGILDDIAEVSKIVEWGKIKGDIENQKDLIAWLETLKEDVEKEISDKTSAIFHYKGSKATYSELPNSAEEGDVWNVEETGANYAWTGTEWDKLSETIDLSGLVTLQALQDALDTIYTKTEVNNLIDTKADKETTYTKEEVDGSIDLVKAMFNNYYTSAECDETFLTEHQSLEGLATENWVDGQGFLKEQDISGKADKSELTQEIADRESAETNLSNRIGTLEGKDNVEYTDISTQELPNRKAIVLNNHDGIFGKDTNNGTRLIGMISKYDVADFGTPDLHTNLNTKQIVTVNDNQAIVTDKNLNQIVLPGDNINIDVNTVTQEGFEFNTYTVKADLTDITTALDTKLSIDTKYGKTIELTINPNTYEVTLNLKDQNNETLSTGSIDLPLESVVVSGSYDNVNKKVILTLTSGSTIEFSVADLVSGLQSEITSENKLSADLIKDGEINKVVTENEKAVWNGKQDVIEDLATIRGNASNGNDAFITISNYGDIVTHNANEFLTEHQSLEDYYTKEQTDEKIHEVIGNAPETLDTLEEIAARLEDGTIASQIAELQSKLHRLQTYVDHYLVLTPEQEQQVANTNAIETAVSNGETSITLEEGSVCDVVIPETTKSVTVNANLDTDTSLELTSPKSVTLNNTGNSVVNLDITAPSDGSVPTVTLNGNYDEISVENASVKINEGQVNKVVISEDTTKNVTVNGKLSENTEIESSSISNLTIGNTNEADTVNLTLNAPNSTVTLNGTYNELESTVGDNTLIVGPNTHIKELTVKKGNVIVKDRDINNRIDTVINETEYTVLPYTVEVNEWTDLSGITSNAGKYIINQDIIAENKNLAYGIFGSGNAEIDLNGKTLKFGRSSNGLVFIRGTVSFNVVGNGYVENTADSYGIWVSSETSEVNIYGGTWLASTHCMYAEKGTINIYGGEFKVKGEDKKFLLNCLDASYTSGKAHINVYGGKFYGFNPAQSMGEPGGPVSFVAPGYHVVETVVDNETVYEVVAD